MKKILIVTYDFEQSGITSFLIPFANYISKNNNVTIAYVSDGDNKKQFNQSINFIKYNVPSKKRIIFNLIIRLKIFNLIHLKLHKKNNISPIKSTQCLNMIKAKLASKINQKFDIIISAAEFFCNYYIANIDSSCKKYGWVHPDYSKLNINKKIERICFNKLDRIITICEPCRQSLINLFPDFSEKIMCIENMIDIEKIKKLSLDVIDDMYEDCFKIVTVCRIDNSSKRLDRIISTCLLLRENNFPFVWYIVGDGKDYNYISGMIDRFKLNDLIKMVGNKTNPYPYMYKANVFVLSSQYEGMPIVVSESVCTGCPVIVSNYLSAKTQVKPEYGYIVDNDDTLFPLECYKKIVLIKENLFRVNSKIDNSKIEDKIDRLIRGEN